MTGDISIQPVGNWASKLEAALRNVAQDVEGVMQRRIGAAGRIVKDGVMDNFRALSMGGAVQDENGSNVEWSKHRSRMTARIRESAGLGALFPILSLTGKLERGLTNASVSTAGGRLVYRPANDVFLLIMAHQVTGRAIPGATNSFRGQMPLRRIVFWSKSMVQQMQTLIRADVKSRHG